MSMEILEKYYGIKPESSIQDVYANRYILNDSIYTIVPVTHVEQETLIELYEISEHMAKYQDKKVSRFIAQAEGKFLITHEEQDYVLLKNTKRKSDSKKNVGRMLAKFHERGKELQIQVSSINRIGQWKEYWITRLEQLEKVWQAAVQGKPEEEFERLFIESFPYYLGLCENAIQYVTDTEIDTAPQYFDRGTVCHERFHNYLWQESSEIRNPFDWVYDYNGRDIAEWIRDCYFRLPRSFQPEIISFIQGYQSVVPISEFSWRLIYARLLFPLHYFTCVEEYYSAESKTTQKQLKDKLRRFIRDTSEYELFLKHFNKIIGTNTTKNPIIDWL